jgi:hypothetical protein
VLLLPSGIHIGSIRLLLLLFLLLLLRLLLLLLRSSALCGGRFSTFCRRWMILESCSSGRLFVI